MAESAVNDFCRLCKANCRKGDRISNTKKIYEREGPDNKSLFQRLAAVGLQLQPREDRSFRICLKCFRLVKTIESLLLTLNKWKLSEETGPEPTDSKPATTLLTPPQTEKRSRESPSQTPRPVKRPRLHPPTPLLKTPGTRQSVVEVMIQYPSAKPATVKCPTSVAGIVENVAKEKWSTAANLIMKHDLLLDKIQESVLILLDNECKRLCHPKQKQEFMLFRCSPDDLKSFSFAEMESDLERLAPFLFSLLSTITNQSSLKTCAAASVLLRGRNDKLPSAFAYYINSILQCGGAKKTVYQRLCKLGISTNHDTAVKKRRLLANTCGDALQQLRAPNEVFFNPQQDSDGHIKRLSIAEIKVELE